MSIGPMEIRCVVFTSLLSAERRFLVGDRVWGLAKTVALSINRDMISRMYKMLS